ncbi:ABC transporter permease subunit [Spiroplasma chrysopicola]|uniref:Uncharacterized protein n=1 Tax=Spiroplasma chrysopicola DF-1 TaxID=1276227 RepID=R4U4T0_9MOLU|nr:ABC transporter permease subunit [Spiroplasma chrysopicola]AGM25568.1 hypothetical protein SCHRY_v1c09960 [Spiroplasma chrysopicola DF-1]
MKKKVFGENLNIIRNHLRLNWKLILFFGLFWLLITIILLSMTLISHVNGVKVPVIANISAEIRTQSSSSGDNLTSISNMLNWGLFGGPGISFFAIFSLVLINKSFLKELNNSQISFWLTLPLSKKQVLHGKISYILISNLIIFIPSYLIVLIFAGISYDANSWFGYVALYGLQFIIFIFLLITLYFLISNCLSDKTMVSNIINSLIIFWILVTWIISLIYDMNPETFKTLKYFQYVSLQSLIVIPIKFSQNDIAEKIVKQLPDGNTLTLVINKHLSFNNIAISVCTVMTPIMTVGLVWINILLFKNKNLNL